MARRLAAAAMFGNLTGICAGLAMMCMAGTASAALVNVDASGQLVGAFNVNVSGTLYNVEFLDGSCIDLFSGCNEQSDFDFTSEGEALLAAGALLNQVFLDGPLGNFDSDPTLTAGCTFPSSCNVFVPFEVGVFFAEATNNASEPDGLGLSDTAPFADKTYATFAVVPIPPAVVPIPPALWLMVSALLALAVPFWRKRRLGDVEV